MNLPGPVNELIQVFINLGRGFENFVQRTVGPIPVSNADFVALVKNLSNLFQTLNTWFTVNLGTSLVQLLKAIGNFLVWLLEGLAYLIRLGLQFVQ